MRNFLVFSIGISCLHCSSNGGSSSTNEPPLESSPLCAEGMPERGKWRIVDYPIGLSSDIGTSDEDGFVLLGGENCGFCQLNELDALDLEWEVKQTKDFIFSSKAGQIVATSAHLGAINISTHQASSVFYPRTLSVLERETLHWSQHELPETLTTRHESGLFWTGREFLVFGGNVANNGAKVYLDDTPMTSFSDGAFFDPSTDQWRVMKPAWQNGEHLFGINPPQGGLHSVWTPEGFFVWGVDADERRIVSAVYLVESDSWKYLDDDESPPLRKHAELSYHDGFVYLFSGHEPGVDLLDHERYYRDFWRASSNDWKWERIDVAPFADLQASKAEWIDDELVFIGHHCANASIYDPKKNTWSVASAENAPPIIDDYGRLGFGELSSAQRKLFINNVSINGLTLAPAVWVLSL